MNLARHIPDDIVARLSAVSANPERPALEALRQAADKIERADGSPSDIAAARAAADRIQERRKGATLGGLRIKDIINEGRR